MATATAPKVENPKIPADLNFTPPATDDAPPTDQAISPDAEVVESDGKDAAPAVKAGDIDGGSKITTDIEKKMKRAERFGVTVQLSEAEKRNSRAERFGTAATVTEVDSSKSSEELKRKARAERFGTVNSAPTADEDVKKKARLARFGSSPPTDSVEEDKKKARAARFSQPDTGSKANGKAEIEVKTTIAGKAGGGT